VTVRGGEAAFLLAAVRGRTLVLTASDVRAFQLAKAAVRAGIELLLREAGARAEDVDTVFLAGAFGGGLDAWNAASAGLFPAAFAGRTARAGNASLAAAARAAAEEGFVKRVARFARRLAVVDLAGHREFPSWFLRAMEFPRGASAERRPS